MTCGPQRLLTVPEAAERINVTERMIRRLVADRRLPFYKVGNHVRIDEAELLKFVSAGRVDAVR